MGRVLSHLSRTSGPSRALEGPLVRRDLSDFRTLGNILSDLGQSVDSFESIKIHDGRNFTLELIDPSGGGLVIKQHREETGSALHYELLANREILPAFRKQLGEMDSRLRKSIQLPKLMASDENDRYLVSTRFEKKSDLSNILTRSERELSDLHHKLGRIVGTFHAWSGDTLEQWSTAALQGLSNRFDDDAQLRYNYDAVNVDEYVAMSESERQSIALLQYDHELRAQLRTVSLRVRRDTVIHGDLRPENVLLGPDTTGEALCLIDWELVRIGDPREELGYYIGQLIHRSLESIRAPAPTLDSWRSERATHLTRIQLLAASLLDGYEMGFGADVDRTLVSKLAGVSLLSQVIGVMRERPNLRSRDMLLVDTARNMILEGWVTES